MSCSSDNSWFQHVTSCVQCVQLSELIWHFHWRSMNMYSCTLDMYFVPEPTIVCQCINIGSATPNKMNLLGVSYRGWGGGGLVEIPLPLSQPQYSSPRNLEIEYGYCISYLHVTEDKYVSSKCCLENLSQIASEAIWEDLNLKFSWEGMLPDPLSRHVHILQATISFTILFPPSPPSQNPVWNPAASICKWR